MKNKQYWLPFWALLILLFTSCNSNAVYDSYVSIPKDGWSKDSVARFDIAIDNIEPSYNIQVKVRNTNSYPNANLWLFIDAKSPSGIYERDTVECFLADPKGKWYGSGLGSLHHLNLSYKRNIKFTEVGIYTFHIAHGMRKETLKGITDIGVSVDYFEE